MAQFVSVEISIDGKTIKQFSSFSLSQSIFDHHQFTLVCPAESIDGTSAGILNTSKDMIGATISVQINAVMIQATLQFSGVITQVEASRHNGHAGNIVITGYSPTILLDNGPHCKTWEKKALKNIIQDILQFFPQNILPSKVSPSYGETFSYMVQYKETAWQFINRICGVCGEWLLYDGQKLCIGPLQSGAKQKLVFGSTLQEFSMALEVRPSQFTMMGYDYMNEEVYSSAPSGIAGKAGLNDFGKHVLQKSEKFYSVKPKQWHNQFLTNKKQLDDYINTRASEQSSSMVRFNGSSGQPGVQVGGTVSVEGKNMYSQSDESFGDYHVVSINHHCDGQGNYSNDFMAIPATVKMPPITASPEPHCETQSAVVTDNHDPNGLGRVRVRFHWMSETQKSPWLRITGMHGGDSKGMFFIPEVGEEVITGFEGDSPVKPYVIGSVYNAKAKTTYSNSDNDVKAIQTRSGNKIIMNDKEGSVFVEDKDGNSIKMDGDGNLNALSNKSIVLTCGDSKIEMKKDGTIKITGKNITVTADEKAKMESKQASFTADGNGGEAKMEGMKANINGSVETKVAGGAKTEISASGNVAVKGAIIMLN